MLVVELLKSSVFRWKHKKVLKCSRSAVIDAEDIFDGANFVGKNAYLIDCHLGYGSYVAYESRLFHCKVGKYSCIGPYVKIVTGKHPIEFASMHPFFYSRNNQIGKSYVAKDKFQELDYVDEEKHYQVQIGNDVWIGSGVQILGGVRIGDGAVVAAGAFVTKDVEPYSIVGGIPAKKIRMRFDKETVGKLMETRWWEFDEKFIMENAESFDDVNRVIERFEKIEHS